MSWSDLPRATPTGAPRDQVDPADFNDLASAIVERGALVGLDYSTLAALDVAGDDQILASHVTGMQSAVSSMCSRYYDSSDDPFTLATLRSAAGLSGSDWTRIPARVAGTATYGQPESGDPICVEHVNELTYCIKQLTRIRLTYVEAGIFTKGAIVQNDYDTSTMHDTYVQAHNAACAAAVNRPVNSTRYMHYWANLEDNPYWDHFVAHVVHKSFKRLVQFPWSPIWVHLPGTLSYTGSRIFIEWEEAYDSPDMSPDVDTNVRSSSGTENPTDLPYTGASIGASFPLTAGEADAEWSGYLPNSASREEVATYFELTDYKTLRTINYPPPSSIEVFDQYAHTEGADRPVFWLTTVTNFTYS